MSYYKASGGCTTEAGKQLVDTRW